MIKASDKGGRREVQGRCYNCGKREYEIRNCPDREKARKCYTCQGFGHLSTDCPQRRGGGSNPGRPAQVNRVVNEMHEDTLTSSNRNWKNVTIQGKKTVYLIDSVSNYNLMREDIYRELQPLTLLEEPERLRGAGGVVVTLGKVEASTEIDGAVYELIY